MSGGGSRSDGFSGGSIGGSSGGGAGGAGGTDCDALIQTAPLNSPVPDLVDQLSRGQKLKIELQQQNGRNILAVVSDQGVVGSLTHLDHAKIIACISEGYSYRAVVTNTAGGAVQLRIEKE